MKKIRAHYMGEDLTLGYERDKSYTLFLKKGANPGSILINKSDGSCDCIYTDFIDFLNSWDLISVLDKN